MEPPGSPRAFVRAATSAFFPPQRRRSCGAVSRAAYYYSATTTSSWSQKQRQRRRGTGLRYGSGGGGGGGPDAVWHERSSRSGLQLSAEGIKDPFFKKAYGVYGASIAHRADPVSRWGGELRLLLGWRPRCTPHPPTHPSASTLRPSHQPPAAACTAC